MERQIKIEYNPKRAVEVDYGNRRNVGLMDSIELTAQLDAVSKVYVSPTGDDANNGLSNLSPVRTITRAIDIAVVDDYDAIIFMPGMHSYYASYNLFGKMAIALPGAQFTNVDIYFSNAYGADAFPATPLMGIPVWFTGRGDMPENVEKSNRLYWPGVCRHPSGGSGILKLLRFNMYYDNDLSLAKAVDSTEYEWQVDNFFDVIDAYFIGLGYTSFTRLGDAFVASTEFDNLPENLVAMTDGAGKVFVVTSIVASLTGSMAYGSRKRLHIIWYNGEIKYWYEMDEYVSHEVTHPTGSQYWLLNVGSADTAGPAIAYSVDPVSGYHRYSAIQPNKRVTDTGYKYEVTKSEAIPNNSKYMVAGVYYDGVPMFSKYNGDGLCYSAQQISDALQSAGGSYSALPTWAKDFFSASQRQNAKAMGYRRPGRPYNVGINANGLHNGHILRPAATVNPNSPYVTGPRMLSTNAPASSKDPVFFESSEAFGDNLFYGGAVINFLWYAPADNRTYYASILDLSNDGITEVYGLGINSRLQNCEVLLTDFATQKNAYEAGGAIWNYKNRLKVNDPNYVEAWIPNTEHSPVADGDASTDSQLLKIGEGYRGTVSRYAAGIKSLKESIFVGVNIISVGVKLWHVSAATCGYAVTDDIEVYGCAFAHFSGYYLTPDGSPMTILHSVIREAVSQNLIPPDSTLTNVKSADPLFKSVENPYDLRLKAISKGDFIDSPAIALTPQTSFFGGQREAGAYDDKGSLIITWDSFLIVFPWVMPIDSGRTILENQRRDGVQTRISVSKTSIKLSLQWPYALSKDDLINIERLLNADESIVRIYFSPVSKPDKYLSGYIRQNFKTGGPISLMSLMSDKVQLEFSTPQPADSIYNYL